MSQFRSLHFCLHVKMGELGFSWFCSLAQRVSLDILKVLWRHPLICPLLVRLQVHAVLLMQFLFSLPGAAHAVALVLYYSLANNREGGWTYAEGLWVEVSSILWLILVFGHVCWRPVLPTGSS